MAQKIPVLITCKEFIDDSYPENNKEIIVSYNDNKVKKRIKLNKNEILYTNEIYNIIMILIESSDNLCKDNFLELDPNLFLDNSEIIYEYKSLYILHYSKDRNSSLVSYGSLNKKVGYNLVHSCKVDSSGAPILNLENNKVIGLNIAKECFNDKYYPVIFLKYVLNDLNKINNQIGITLQIEEGDLNKEIYFLDNTIDYEDKNGNKSSHNKLKELNENNVKLFIGKKEYKYKKYFRPTKTGKYSIILKLNGKIKDCSFMFYNCNNIINIDLSLFNNNNIINMNSMFSGCSKLKFVDLYSINTENVIDMANIFEGCYNLNIIDLSAFRTKKVTSMKNMFYDCREIANLNLSWFNTENVTDMSGMFSICVNLISIDLSNFNTKNVTNMRDMFSSCERLISVNLSSFNTKNVTDMSSMFRYCLI